MSAKSVTSIDERNAAYWNSLCGWAMAQEMKMTGDEREDLRRFDAAYLEYYPYLLDYIHPERLVDRDVLEIGLGYGTVGQLLAMAGARYVGVDVAVEPVALMERRLGFLSDQVVGRAVQASALDLPFEAESFDVVYSIGCLHHTGDLQRGIDEVHRVLRPGGEAVVMVYYDYSLRRILHRLRWLGRQTDGAFDAQSGALYDVDPTGAAPPHTEYAGRERARELFSKFSRVSLEVQNFSDYSVGGFFISRRWFLDNIVAHRLGLDIYVQAWK